MIRIALRAVLRASDVHKNGGVLENKHVKLVPRGSSGSLYRSKSTAAAPQKKTEEEICRAEKSVNSQANGLETTVKRTGGQTLSDDGHPYVDLTFNNAHEAFRSKSTLELMRALFVFNLCSVNFLVERNKEILKMVRKLLGKRLFTKVMKMTFYGHFVAGEDQESIRPIITRNRQYGVKSILDYSVEEDLSTEQAVTAEMMSAVSEDQPDDLPLPQDDMTKKFRAHKEFGDRRTGVISARTYFYEGEAQCDKNMQTFLDCIDAVSDVTDGSGFAAIKLTALGRPQLLLQMSEVLVQTRVFFRKFCSRSGGDTFLSRIQQGSLDPTDNIGVPFSRDEARNWLTVLDLKMSDMSGTDELQDIAASTDLLDWDNLMRVNVNLSKLFVVPNLKTGKLEPLVTALTKKEEREMKNMLQRINTIAEYAVEKGARVMIDAEQSYFQPAISRLTMEMMRKFNRNGAFIFNTYQSYLKQAAQNISLDMDLANREGFYFGAKVVRGAYMEQERERAATLHYEDPINPTYEATTVMYHGIMHKVMAEIKRREMGKIAVMVASHNEDTVRYTVEKMKEFGIRPSDRVICFGQLFGMCDQVSFPLGQAGYSVYKYVPFGPVEDVIPYLSRRAMENRGILTKVQKEKRLLRSEIKDRLKKGKLFYTPPEK